MSEYDPDAYITIQVDNGDEIVANRHNTALFAFIGALSVYDHIFVARETIDGGYSGLYIFSNNESYPAIAEYIVREKFPIHMNLNEVAECDYDAFMNAQTSDLDRFIPEEWENGTE